MNIIKISQLPTTSALSGNELIPIVQAGITKAVESTLLITKVDVTPVDENKDIPISSDWAFDHAVRVNTLEGYFEDKIDDVYNYFEDRVDTLYDYLTYIPPSITFFKINGTTEIILEKGASLVNPVFNWALSGSSPYILNISGIGNVPITSTAYVVDAEYTQDADWTLTAADKNPLDIDVYAEKTVSLRFKDKIYWGALAGTSLSNEDVFLLNDSAFESGLARAVTYNATGGRYPYYVYPARFGPINRCFVNGLRFSDFTEWQMTFTNAYGVSSAYRVVRFDTLQHGSNIEVSWS